jgi:hypothetical protein
MGFQIGEGIKEHNHRQNGEGHVKHTLERVIEVIGHFGGFLGF